MLMYNTLQLGKPIDKNIRFPPIYTLYRNGMTKTLKNRGDAVAFLKTGKWLDRTQYETKDEVINYEEISKHGSPETCSPSEREKSGHQQYQSNASDETRKKLEPEAVRPRPSSGEVRKRGRPKRVNK
jgi:hypothetical protein